MLKNRYSPFFCDVVNSVLTVHHQHIEDYMASLFIYKLPCFVHKKKLSMLLLVRCLSGQGVPVLSGERLNSFGL